MDCYLFKDNSYRDAEFFMRRRLDKIEAIGTVFIKSTAGVRERKFPVGAVTNRKDGKYVKTAQGWVRVRSARSAAKPNQGTALALQGRNYGFQDPPDMSQTRALLRQAKKDGWQMAGDNLSVAYNNRKAAITTQGDDIYEVSLSGGDAKTKKPIKYSNLKSALKYGEYHVFGSKKA